MQLPRARRLAGPISATAISATFVLAVAAAGPAWADTTLPLHQTNVTAAGFGSRSCDHVPGGATAGKDGWVFVLPGNKGDFTSLTLTFKGDGNATVRHIPGDGTIVDSKGTSKAVLQTPAGWTLVSGTATISGTAPTKFFNLTHTCPSTGKASGSGSPSPSRSPEVTPSPSGGSNGGGGGSGGSLPITGTAVGGLIALSLALIAAGAALMAMVRRRRSVE
jgi:hypothetical protein